MDSRNSKVPSCIRLPISVVLFVAGLLIGASGVWEEVAVQTTVGTLLKAS